MKGVIVATGLGQYLSSLTIRFPKRSISVPERPLIDYAIEAFANAGFEELGVVLGPNEGILRTYLQDSARYGIAIYCLYNPWYLRGSATSLYAARPFVRGEPFILAFADRILSPYILFPLLVYPWHTHVMCVTRRHKTGSRWHGTTKVQLDSYDRVQHIGKHLQHWHAVETGIFLFQPHIFHSLSNLLRRSAKLHSIVHLVRYIIACGDDLLACDVSGYYDPTAVDRWDHLHYRQQVLSVSLAQEKLVA